MAETGSITPTALCEERHTRIDKEFDQVKEGMHEHDKRFETMAILDERISTLLDQTAENLKDLNARMSVLEAKPGKRWDAIIDRVITAVAAGVIGFLFARMGLN